MTGLPTGTVTFLFTDIEGSTARWEHQTEAMRLALARHDALLRAAIREHGGHVVKTMGDAFHAAFSRAPEALGAAVDAQRRLIAESWDEIGGLRVRMALHTGAAEERDGDYYGPPLNRAARLMSAGHGGQVLLSQTTYDLVRDTLPDGAALLDLGEHRLKDLIRPERIFQVVAPSLPSTFPPLQSLERRPHNLPIHPTALLGRDDDVARVRERLLRDELRLLTLTGPGGTGKTRLSLQVAADVVDRFMDGVYVVALAPISDPGLVASTIAQTLDVRVDARRPVVDSLKEHLADKQILLLLDNFEQILPAASVVSDLLSAAPRLKILVTSRAALQVRGEHEYPVPPLALPDRRAMSTPASLSQYGAVSLFIERAGAIKPDFTVTNENAPAIAEICHRLDGLPLAIELAAARTRLLSPQAILSRLERRLPLLTGGARDLPARQQTLRNAIAWSYDLLSPQEQTLYRRLSVFVGGCTLEAAEAVAGVGSWVIGDGGNADDRPSPVTQHLSPNTSVDVLDGVSALVAQSLIRQIEGQDGEPRFTMLETIREFGLECLEASGEAPEIRRAHAAYVLALVRDIEPNLIGPGQRIWFQRLTADLDNLRVVLGRCQTGELDAEIGLEIVGRGTWFWGLRGLTTEGHGWLDAMLALPVVTARTAARAWALQGASVNAVGRADYVAVEAFGRESAAIFRETGDLQNAGRAMIHHATGLSMLGDQIAARSVLEESASLARAVGDQWGLAFALGQLGATYRNDGDLAAARPCYEESAAISREIADPHTLGLTLASLAYISRAEGELIESAALWREALVVNRTYEDLWLFPRVVAGMAGAAVLVGDYERAARLFGVTEAMREATGTREAPFWQKVVDRDVATVLAALGDEAFAAASARGHEMTREQAVAYALDDSASPDPARYHLLSDSPMEGA